MTEKEFKEEIQKGLWYQKYYYYFLTAAVIIVGGCFLYKGIAKAATGEELFDVMLFILPGIIFLFSGTTFISLIRKRYSVKEFICNLPKSEKESIIREVAIEFNAGIIEKSKDLWFFTSKYKWWLNGYRCYLGLSDKGILVSFFARTGSNGGFVDFGQTNRRRRKLYHLLYKKINYMP